MAFGATTLSRMTSQHNNEKAALSIMIMLGVIMLAVNNAKFHNKVKKYIMLSVVILSVIVSNVIVSLGWSHIKARLPNGKICVLKKKKVFKATNLVQISP
jgi:predicted tellurium resistance membrane protein TerC